MISTTADPTNVFFLIFFLGGGGFALIEYIATVPHYSKYPREGYKDIFLPTINILKEKF